MHKNLYLDAEDPDHFEGRYINDAKGSSFKTNVRFAANYRVNTCSVTGKKWVRIYATRKIRAGEELFLDYGKDFWHMVDTEGRTSDDQWAISAEIPSLGKTSDDQWAISAVIPSFLTNETQPTPDADNTPTKANAPHTPTTEDENTSKHILGHYNTDNPNPHTPLIFPHLSPIRQHTHSTLNETHIHLNDTYMQPPHINITDHIHTTLTPLQNTFILQPNPALYK